MADENSGYSGDPNDYGAAANYVLNDQGNYVNGPSYESSVDITPVNSPADWSNYSAPETTFDTQSFSQPADYNFGSIPSNSNFVWNDPGWQGGYTDQSLAAYQEQNSVGNVNDWTWETTTPSYSPSVLVPEVTPALDSSQSWWDNAGQNLGSWWNQATTEAGNWLTGNYGGGGNVSGTIENPISQDFADSPWSKWISGPSTETEWKAQEAPWNVTGEDKKWIKETAGGVSEPTPEFLFGALSTMGAAGKDIGIPTQGESKGTIGEPVYADMIPSSFGKEANGSSVTPAVAPSGATYATGKLQNGSSFILSQGDTDQTFKIDKIVRDSKTGEIKSAEFTNSKFPDQPMVYKGGNVIDEANKQDKVVTTSAAPSVPPNQTTSPETPGIPGTTTSQPFDNIGKTAAAALSQTPELGWNPDGTARNINQIYFGKTSGDYAGLGMFSGHIDSNGKVIGFNYIDDKGRTVMGTYDISDPNHYKVVSLERDGQPITDKYVKQFGESIAPVAAALSNGYMIGNERQLSDVSGASVLNNHFLYNYATGEPTALGKSFGLERSGILQAANQNIQGQNVAMDSSKIGFMKIGDQIVPTYDPNTINAAGIRAILETDRDHPGYAALAQKYGINPVNGAAYTSYSDNPSRMEVIDNRPYGGNLRVNPGQFDVFSENAPALEAAKTISYINSVGYVPGGKDSNTVLAIPEFMGLSGQGGYDWINQAPAYMVTALSNGSTETGNLQSNVRDIKNAKAGYGTVSAETEQNLIGAGNKFESQYGAGSIFPLLNSEVYLKRGSNGQVLADSSQIYKSILAERGGDAQRMISGANFWMGSPTMRDIATRTPTPVDVGGTPMMTPWTWNSYLSKTGSLDDISGAYVPNKLQGRNVAVAEIGGKMTTPSYVTMFGDKNAGNYTRWLPSPGFVITSMDGNGSTSPYVGYTPVVAVPGSDYLKTVYPTWGHCTNCGGSTGGGKCTSCGSHARKKMIVRKQNAKMRTSKGVSC